jgi:DNA-binding beta-propeller fold protein YncE
MICCRSTLLLLLFSVAVFAHLADDDDDRPTLLPTGKQITPLAAPHSRLQYLNPGLPDFPNFIAGQAMSTVVSPDAKTLLLLTSGYNRVIDAADKQIDSASQEYVFVFDIAAGFPKQTQVLKVPNTFAGIAFSSDGLHFYVSGGKDDNLHIFSRAPSDGAERWAEDGEPISLKHVTGLGFKLTDQPLASGGVAVSPDGKTAIIANIYNDSLTFVDLVSRSVKSELDLRPGKINPRDHGVAGGEYPFWVTVINNTTAVASSLRDREIVKLDFSRAPAVTARIKVPGNPNKMIVNKAASLLYVAQDNSDLVSIINTGTNRIVENIVTTVPAWLLSHPAQYTGSGPNSLALSPDEKTLYVTNGGSNCVSVIRLGAHPEVVGLIPTAWFPNSVSVDSGNHYLYVANAKTMPGPNKERGLRKKKQGELQPGPALLGEGQNEYILQLEKGSLLTIPLPDAATLNHLTRVVAANNNLTAKADPHDQQVMAELRQRIKHVIYIIKENRTYDQILGDLGRGNGDPSLTEFGEAVTPNFHAIARQFVDLDNFYNSGEVSGNGWPWSTAGRESDYGQKAVTLNYAGRGTAYEYEGQNRDINVGLATLEERKQANPKTPDDPDLLPGASNVAAPDGPAQTKPEKGYIWDAVLRKGLTFREYGCMSDMLLGAPRERHAFDKKIVLSRPSNPELYKYGDPYFPGFDPGYPDFYREAEWEREFDAYVANKNLPSFEIVQLPVDHMGDFQTAIDRVNTPETQQADNDYGTARLIDRVAHSPYKDSTLIFIVEDDSQDGPDHVDAHRSTAYIVGPYVKQAAVVSTYYTTVSVVRTIEDVLGLQHLNLNTATAAPMTAVFDLSQKDWTFDAKPSAVLLKTDLPLSPAARAAGQSLPDVPISHAASYWAAQTVGFDFSAEDRVDAGKFNRVIWQGIMARPYPKRDVE